MQVETDLKASMEQKDVWVKVKRGRKPHGKNGVAMTKEEREELTAVYEKKPRERTKADKDLMASWDNTATIYCRKRNQCPAEIT